MKNLILILLTGVLPLAAFADVRVADFAKLEEDIRPANVQGAHTIGKCDSERTKRRAHQLGFMSDQKKNDVAMQGRCYTTCEILAETQPNQAGGCIRECNDQQREQRKDGANSAVAGAGIVGGVISLLTAL